MERSLCVDAASLLIHGLARSRRSEWACTRPLPVRTPAGRAWGPLRKTPRWRTGRWPLRKLGHAAAHGSLLRRFNSRSVLMRVQQSSSPTVEQTATAALLALRSGASLRSIASAPSLKPSWSPPLPAVDPRSCRVTIPPPTRDCTIV